MPGGKVLFGALLLVGWLGSLGIARAQPDEEAASDFGRRYDAFRLLAQEIGNKEVALGRVGELKIALAAQYANWIVVLLGDTRLLEAPPIPWASFLEEGGTLIVASESAVGPFLPGLANRIEPGPVRVRMREDAYRGRLTCPLVRDLDQRHPVTRDLSMLAFNRAGFLADLDEETTPLARLPRLANVGTASGLPPACVAVRSVGKGRVLWVADSSVFSNEMILELDNIFFAAQVLRYSYGDRPKKSLKVLFMEEGYEPAQWLDPRFATGNWSGPTLEQLIALINETIAGLEDEDTLNQVIAGKQERFGTAGYKHGLLLVLATILFAGLLWRLWLLRAAPVVAGPLLVVPPRAPAGDYRPAARLLAEEYFAIASPDAAWRTRPPAPPAGGSPWRRWRRRGVLRWLRRLALGSPIGPIGRRKFVRLARSLDRLAQESKSKEGKGDNE